MKGQVLASSPTLDGIKRCVATFYGGERGLRASMPKAAFHGCACLEGSYCDVNHDPEDGPTEWTVRKADGAKLRTVVRLVRGRYRFEIPGGLEDL